MFIFVFKLSRFASKIIFFIKDWKIKFYFCEQTRHKNYAFYEITASAMFDKRQVQREKIKLKKNSTGTFASLCIH